MKIDISEQILLADFHKIQKIRFKTKDLQTMQKLERKSERIKKQILRK